MTDREAIETIEECKRQGEIIKYNPTTFYSSKDQDAGIKTMQRHIDAYNSAISAIQEREERSKGCRYCTGVVLNVVDETTVFEAGFNFCPMCGRPLKGADDES